MAPPDSSDRPEASTLEPLALYLQAQAKRRALLARVGCLISTPASILIGCLLLLTDVLSHDSPPLSSLHSQLALTGLLAFSAGVLLWLAGSVGAWLDRIGGAPSDAANAKAGSQASKQDP